MKINPAFYAVFKVMVDLAANCPIRGLLARDGEALDIEYMSDDGNIPEDLFRAGVEALVDKRIGWIETVEIDEKTGHVIGDGSETATSTLPDQSSEVAPSRAEPTEAELSEAKPTEAEPSEADGSGGCAIESGSEQPRPQPQPRQDQAVIQPGPLGEALCDTLARIWPLEFGKASPASTPNRKSFQAYVRRIYVRDGPEEARVACRWIVSAAQRKHAAGKVGELRKPVAALNAEVIGEFGLNGAKRAGYGREVAT